MGLNYYYALYYHLVTFYTSYNNFAHYPHCTPFQNFQKELHAEYILFSYIYMEAKQSENGNRHSL